MRVLVTGAAGFIGYHVSRQLLARGDEVIGVDNLNAYYDPQLKRDRLAQLTIYPRFKFSLLDLADPHATDALLAAGQIDVTVHLAAQAGVRYSQEAPQSYAASNVVGTLNVLEACRARGRHHLVFASSSSVYGESTKFPVAESADVIHPVSLYAATKMASELMAYSYVDQYEIAATGLRLFTVYGPWGRPDMAVFKFTDAILTGRPVDLYAGGVLRRDFTFVDDIAQGIVGAVDHPPTEGGPQFRAYNLGRGEPASVIDLLTEIERSLGTRATRRSLPPQIGDVDVTFADIRAARAEIGYRPSVSLGGGIPRFVDWYRTYISHSQAPLRQSA
jgi:UDP-glucuronate 4-epimerase